MLQKTGCRGVVEVGLGGGRKRKIGLTREGCSWNEATVEMRRLGSGNLVFQQQACLRIHSARERKRF